MERALKKMRAFKEKHPGEVEVVIRDTEAPITLILTSYEPTVWILELARGVEVKEIYLSSYHRSKVVNADDSALETCFLDDGCTRYVNFFENDSKTPYLYDDSTESCSDEKAPGNYYLDGMEHIKEKFHRRPDSLQGVYKGRNFLIDRNIRGDTLKVTRESGFCYKDKYGKLQPYDLDFEIEEE